MVSCLFHDLGPWCGRLLPVPFPAGPGGGWEVDGAAPDRRRKLSLGGAVESMAAAAGRVYAVITPPGGQRSELYASPAGRDAWDRVGRITVQPFTGLAVSATAAWLTGSSRVWATADGRTWHRYPVRCPAPFAGLGGVAPASRSQVYFLCIGPGFAGGAAKTVLRSTDGGKTEHLVGPAPAEGHPAGFAVPPGRSQIITLAATSGDSWLYRSADGGKTWTASYTTDSAPWNSLSYVSRTAGWAVLGWPPVGGLLRTTDVGRTWHQVRFTSLNEPVTAYVANSADGTVTPIRTATHKALKAIKVRSDPFAIAITPNGDRLRRQGRLRHRASRCQPAGRPGDRRKSNAQSIPTPTGPGGRARRHCRRGHFAPGRGSGFARPRCQRARAIRAAEMRGGQAGAARRRLRMVRPARQRVRWRRRL
jgi:YVTN family beta-propeller protein